MLLNDWLIRLRCTQVPAGQEMITPFSEAVSGDGVISFGLTSAGYDMRLGAKAKIFKNTSGETINPKRFKDPEYCKRMFDDIEVKPHEPFIIPAHSYMLGISHEYFRIPKDLKGRIIGKSTYARCAIICNLTPAEPSWRGHLTLEISNSCQSPVEVFSMEGIAQIEFEMLVMNPDMCYERKGGKYQNTMEVTPAIVK